MRYEILDKHKKGERMIHEFDGYGSHIMILDKIKKIIDYNTILEYGGGEYSTPYFMGIPGAEVTTIESQDYAWYQKIIKINPNTLWMPDHDKVVEYTVTHNSKRDLVFLDSHQDLRHRLAPIVSDFTDIIVMHDSETASYKYHELPVDFKNWFYADFVLYRPWTGVLCKSKELLQELLSHIPGILYKNMEDKIYLYHV